MDKDIIDILIIMGLGSAICFMGTNALRGNIENLYNVLITTFIMGCMWARIKYTEGFK